MLHEGLRTMMTDSVSMFLPFRQGLVCPAWVVAAPSRLWPFQLMPRALPRLVAQRLTSGKHLQHKVCLLHFAVCRHMYQYTGKTF